MLGNCPNEPYNIVSTTFLFGRKLTEINKEMKEEKYCFSLSGEYLYSAKYNLMPTNCTFILLILLALIPDNPFYF